MAAHYQQKNWQNLGFVAPFLIVFVCMLVIPLIWGLWLSFYKVDLFGPGRYIGLRNYQRLLSDKIFLQTIWNTIKFVFMTVPPLVVLGLALALALNKRTKFASVMRGVFFGSTVLSVTIVTLIWRIVLVKNDGLMAVMFDSIGLEPVAFLTSKTWALPSVAVATIWWCIGLPMMLFTAALQQIEKDIYEAAALDNTSRWRMLTRITLPSLTRTIVLVAIIEIILQFQLFGQSLLMTNGGPPNSSRPIVMYIYETGFQRWDVGMAAAASEVLFVMILGAAMVQYLVTRKKSEG